MSGVLSRDLAERIVMALRTATICLDRHAVTGSDAERSIVLGNYVILDEVTAALRGDTVTQSDLGILA